MANTEVFTRGPINKLLLETRGALLISLGISSGTKSLPHY